MTSHTLLPEEVMIKKAVEALMEALGPVETTRFLNLSRQHKMDAVAWHRQWQASLDAEEFFNEVFEPEVESHKAGDQTSFG